MADKPARELKEWGHRQELRRRTISRKVCMLWSGHALVVAAISPISYVLVLQAPYGCSGVPFPNFTRYDKVAIAPD
jgi:hypothetical protein